MRERLAHVQFRGTIRERTVEPYLGLLKALGEKRRIRGVLLDISSGGGGSVPSSDLYAAVKRLNAVKPVVASIGSIGASGAYLAALGARKIYAYPDSSIGSIGVIYPHLAVEKLLTKLGIDVQLVHEGRHKDAYQGFRPLTDEEKGKLQAVTRDIYDGFVETVARERHQTVEAVQALATGEFWSGRAAARLGLVDAIGDRVEALEELARMAGVPAGHTVRVAPPRPFFDRLLSGGFGSAMPAITLGIRDAVEEAAWELSLGGLK